MEQKSENKFEILSPAGNMENLKAAVLFGADAVYLGLKEYNARSKASNFSREELRLAVLFCHERGVRVYLTMNIILKERELKTAFECAECAINYGIDGILVQDLSLLFMIKKAFPDFPVHASTQLGVHNVYGAMAAERLGFDRVVLSRESSDSDIKEIKRKTNVEMEYFIHGAHCVSFSGNCYFSSIVSGLSGNRGKCLQLCRKRYVLKGEGKVKKGYMLSARDICHVKNIKRLKNLGILSGKIEGRLRSREYSAVTAKIYSKALNGGITSEDMDELKTVFNRGDYSEAYLFEKKPSIISFDIQSNIGLKVGTVRSDGKGFVIHLFLGRKLMSGDGVKVIRKGKELAGGTYNGRTLILDRRFIGGGDLHLTKSKATENEISKAMYSERHINHKYEKPKAWNKNISDKIIEVEFHINVNTKSVIINEDTDLKVIEKADYVFYAPLCANINIIESISKKVHDIGKQFLLYSPVECRGEDIIFYKKLSDMKIFDGYVVNNIYALELFKKHPCIIGPGMNMISDYFDVSKVLSIEAAANPNNDLMLVFGRITLMNLTHCPRLTMGFECRTCKDAKGFYIEDEMGNAMPLRRTKTRNCYWELLNGKILNLGGKTGKMLNRLLIDARDVDTARVISFLDNPRKEKFNDKTDTYGRFGKGVK